jgi:hypothetical protein
MVPDGHPRRPCFQKITNFSGKINEWLAAQGVALPVTTTFPEYAEQQYVPSDSGGCWSSEVVDAFAIRCGSLLYGLCAFIFSHSMQPQFATAFNDFIKLRILPRSHSGACTDVHDFFPVPNRAHSFRKS